MTEEPVPTVKRVVVDPDDIGIPMFRVLSKLEAFRGMAQDPNTCPVAKLFAVAHLSDDLNRLFAEFCDELTTKQDNKDLNALASSPFCGPPL